MYLVTGATSTIGRPLVDTLVAAGRHVRAVSRQPGADLPAEVEVVSPEAIAAVMPGVEGLFVHPRATKDHGGELLKLAALSGVGRVVVMSAINVDDEPDHQPSRYKGDRNTEVEQAVVASGLPWVSVRPSSFAVNALTLCRKVIGRPLRYQEIPADTVARAMIERGLGEEFVRALMDRDVREMERTPTVTGEVEAMLGRPARSFATWVADHQEEWS